MSTATLTIKSARVRYGVELGELESWRDGISKHRVFIADARVLLLHPRVATALAGEHVLHVEATEANKTLRFASETILPFLLEHRVSRASTVVAIGGGIVQDLVAFTCSILFRGVRWWFYPTTLLAQADSCIGSKTSINHAGLKNLLGTFFPPQRIVIDARFLTTLTALDHASGIGEIVKINLLEGERAVSELSADMDRLWARLPEVEARHVLASLAFKKRYIELDEYDEGPRLVLNYGHCVGHAIEAATRYVVPHGIAVMYGIAVANRLSVTRGLLSETTCRAMNALFERRLPLADVIAQTPFDAILEAMRGDKKNLDGKLVVIVSEGYGKMKREVDVAPDDIRAAFEDTIKEMP